MSDDAEVTVAAPQGGSGRDYGRGSLLEIQDLIVEYVAETPVRAVDSVSLSVDRGEFLGIVGESGCGKSTLLFAVTQLLTPPAEIVSGSVRFKGRNLVELSSTELRHSRWREYSLVMQSAMNALNPVLTIAAQLRDAMTAHEQVGRDRIQERSAEVMRLVGIDPVHLRSYPHQLSGGMRQRAMIAMALLFQPDLIVMDEPTSALDVVAQRSLMTQIKELQQRLGFAVVFVTHDMSLVGRFSDRLAIMYAGQLVEVGTTSQVFGHPRHPYSVGLLDAFPSIRGELRPLQGIPGSPPDLARPPKGCRFHPRCPRAWDRCVTQEPVSHAAGDGVLVRCHLYDPAAGELS